jgi:hypothetical protein
MVAPNVRATASETVHARARFQSERGELPRPHFPTYFEWAEASFNAYSMFSIDHKTMLLFNTGRQQVVNQLTDQINSARRSVEHLLQWSCYGDGNGTITTTLQSSTDTTAEIKVANAIRLEEGQLIDFIRTGETTPFSDSETECEITKIDDPSQTITVTSGDGGAFAIQVGDRIVNTGSYNEHFSGIGAICDGSVPLQSIAVGDKRTWRPGWDENLAATAAGELSDEKMTQVMDHITMKEGGMPDAIFTTAAIRRKLVSAWRLVQRAPNSLDKRFGWSSLSFTYNNVDIPIYADTDCQEGVMYFLDRNTLALNQLTNGIMLIDPAGPLQQIDQYAMFVGGFAWYGNVTTKRRRSNGRIYNIDTVKPIGTN